METAEASPPAKLSLAIKEGSKKSDQAIGSFFGQQDTPTAEIFKLIAPLIIGIGVGYITKSILGGISSVQPQQVLSKKGAHRKRVGKGKAKRAKRKRIQHIPSVSKDRNEIERAFNLDC